MNLQGGAQNRVLCAVYPALSEYEGKEDKRLIVVARQQALSLLETILAKEAKSRNALRWKTPRLSVLGQVGDYSTD